MLRLTLPEVGAPLSFERMIADRDPGRLLVFCDEDAPVKNPIAALSAMRPGNSADALALAVLIGPEGGFAAEERAALNALPNAVRLSLARLGSSMACNMVAPYSILVFPSV